MLGQGKAWRWQGPAGSAGQRPPPVQLTQARSEQVSVRKEEIAVLHVEAQEEE